MPNGGSGTRMTERGLCESFWPCLNSSRCLLRSPVFPFHSEYPGVWSKERRGERAAAYCPFLLSFWQPWWVERVVGSISCSMT